jgi:tetratricopeptide (TPR) repeat protein
VITLVTGFSGSALATPTVPASAESSVAPRSDAPAPAPELENLKKEDLPNLAKAENPLAYGNGLMLVTGLADQALARGDYPSAKMIFQHIIEGQLAITQRGELRGADAAAYRGLCEAERQLGQRDAALKACREAVRAVEPTISDYAALVRLILAAPALGPDELTEAQDLVEHATLDRPADPATHHLACEVALRAGNQPALDACSKKLLELAPSDPKSASFAYAAALGRQDLEGARAELERARTLGLEAAGIQAMERGIHKATPLWRRSEPLTTALVMLGVLALAAVAWALSARLRHRSPPVGQS